jgi:hypothetical protein
MARYSPNTISVRYNHHLWWLLLLLFSYVLLTVFKNILVFKFISGTAIHVQNCVRNPKKNMKKFYEQYFMNVPGPEPALVKN